MLGLVSTFGADFHGDLSFSLHFLRPKNSLPPFYPKVLLDPLQYKRRQIAPQSTVHRFTAIKRPLYCAGHSFRFLFFAFENFATMGVTAQQKRDYFMA